MTRKLAALFSGTYQGAAVAFVLAPFVREVDIVPIVAGGVPSNPPTQANPVATFADRLPVNTPYVPSNVGDWNGVPPLNVQNALDRIAAKITPIP